MTFCSLRPSHRQSGIDVPQLCAGAGAASGIASSSEGAFVVRRSDTRLPLSEADQALKDHEIQRQLVDCVEGPMKRWSQCTRGQVLGGEDSRPSPPSLYIELYETHGVSRALTGVPL
jgi:hypothetical protein